MLKIIDEVASGAIGIRAACVKHGLNRNTLKLWMTRITVRTLADSPKRAILPPMDEEQKNKECQNEVK